MAMLVQYLSAKVGIATGKNLPELCRAHLPRRGDVGAVGAGGDHRDRDRPGRVRRRGDRAEPAVRRAAVRGGADHRGRRVRHPRAAAARLPALRAGDRRLPRRSSASASSTTSRRSTSTRARCSAASCRGFEGTDSVMLAVGILGATVMPHVVYLHGALVQGRILPRDDAERRSLLRFQRVDVVIAMGLAGVINLTMLVVAASLFHESGDTEIDTIEGAHAGFERADRRRRGAGVRGRAAGVRAVELERRHVRRPGRDAGLHRPSHPAVPAPAGDDGAGARRARDRRGRDRRARRSRRSCCRSGSRSRSCR